MYNIQHARAHILHTEQEAGMMTPSDGETSPPHASLGGPPPQHSAKIVLAGECGVGKTSLLRAFCDADFSSSYVSTIGVDFRIKKVPLDDTEVKLHIWDTAGQERYRSMVTSYFRNAAGVLVCYDASSSAEDRAVHIEKGLDLIKRGASEGVCVVLVGTKLDKCFGYDQYAEYDDALLEGDALSKRFGLPNVMTSSLGHLNVQSPFTEVIDMLKRRGALPDPATLRCAPQTKTVTLCVAEKGDGGGGAEHGAASAVGGLGCTCSRC